jgi:hypothetical protein
MPLSNDPTSKGVHDNIAELTKANASKAPRLKRSRKQIIAIALSHAREQYKKGVGN